MAFVHLDEAKRAAIAIVARCASEVNAVERALVVADLFGKLRVILWAPPEAFEQAQARLRFDLATGCGLWWTNEIVQAAEPRPSDRLWEHAWDSARSQRDSDRLRVLERHRSRTAWFLDVSDPLWDEGQRQPQAPPIIVFYSFKGGLGRSTALASFAIQRARQGERVAVVDFDLDAPGVGKLLAADENGTTSPWGTVDYLLERVQGEVPLPDYYHPCRRVAGDGEIVVVPAGQLNGEYPEKLARVDFDQAPAEGRSTVIRLVEDIRSGLAPAWILLDARTGVSEPAGHLLSGMAHLHVLFGTTSEQSWHGLRLVIERLGKQRLLRGTAQGECLLVHALVPADIEAARLATGAFEARASREFEELYYAEEPEDPSDERVWDVRDLGSEDAPHVPVPISYEARLTHYHDIVDVVEPLTSHDYQALEARIVERFAPEPEA